MTKKTAIILVNWNGFQYSFDCITSLLAMEYRDFTIILVDNASADHSGRQLQQHFPDIILIASPENLGFTGGNNLGIAYAIEHGYTYTLLLNNDTIVTPSFLEELVRYMDSTPSTGVTQPKIYFAHDRQKIWSGGGYYLKIPGITYTKHDDSITDIQPVDWISGCAFFCRTAALEKAGAFAQNMFMYYEDVDLSFRIKKLGLALTYHPGSVIYHVAGASGKEKAKGKEGFISPAIHYYNVRNRIWIAKKYTPVIWIPTVALFHFLYTGALITYFILRLRFTKLSAVLKGVKDGLLGRIITR